MVYMDFRMYVIKFPHASKFTNIVDEKYFFQVPHKLVIRVYNIFNIYTRTLTRL